MSLPKDKHIPVMLEEVLQFFSSQKMTTFFEGTVGAGGHAEALLESHPEIERYIACDRDKVALDIARERLKPWKGKVEFVHANFSEVKEILQDVHLEKIEGFFLTWEFLRCN